MFAENTDFHCHILPAMDDGAYRLEDAIAMAKKASVLGFRKLIATPHYEINYYVNTREKILQKVNEFNEILAKAAVNIQVLPGSEIMLSRGIPKLLEQRQLMTIGDQETHLLVELPFGNRPYWFENVVQSIRALGIIPVLAHPERYEWLKGDAKNYLDLRNLGMEFQCNLGSLAGKYGQEIKKKAEIIKELDIIEYWGSDAHSLRGYEILCGEF